MNKHSTRKLLSLILVFVLTAAAALTGCSGAPETPETTAPIETTAPVETTTPVETTAPAETTVPTESAPEKEVLGEGEKVFDFTVLDRDGVEHHFEIHTDAETVGEALVQLQLIDGEQGPYGLYVKSVLGQKLDYETDKMYWSFTVNGEAAMTGVDMAPITEGESYAFEATAA